MMMMMMAMMMTLNCLLHVLQEHHLTRRLAFTNSLRIRQDCENRSADDWYWETFLPLLFRREPPPGDFDLDTGILSVTTCTLTSAYASSDISEM